MKYRVLNPRQIEDGPILTYRYGKMQEDVELYEGNVFEPPPQMDVNNLQQRGFIEPAEPVNESEGDDGEV